jgi:hypothetical protein
LKATLKTANLGSLDREMLKFMVLRLNACKLERFGPGPFAQLHAHHLPAARSG